ncbi:MAG: hypothetical protein IJ688_11160 [Treponema sp.]|nr:hypothetical protein [Treponema sp.]
MKKIISLLSAAVITVAAFAATPSITADAPLPATTPTTLDDFEEGMYINAVRDGWDQFGNKFMVNEFSTASSTAARWDGKGNCGVLEYADLPGNSSQCLHYECMDMIENNWRNYKYLTFTVNNPNDYPVTVQFYSKTGANWQWGNSDAVTIDSGIHTITVTISTASVAVSSNVLSFGIVFYVDGVHPSSKIYIDDLTLWSKK